MTLSKMLPGCLGLALILSLGSPAQAQSLTPAQQQAIHTILAQHQAQATTLRREITARTAAYFNDVSPVVPPNKAPRFVAFTQQVAQASAQVFAQFDSLPPPMQTPQVAATLMTRALLPLIASLAKDLNLPPQVAATLGQRTERYAHEIAPPMAALAALRRQTQAQIKAVTGTP